MKLKGINPLEQHADKIVLAFASLLLGVTRAFQDVPDEAIALTERARRLSPLDPEAYFFQS
ncbi:MAG: hypothetical protein AAFU70_00365, partial [Planctomycetota bacterium]